jgi:hypothetical protein
MFWISRTDHIPTGDLLTLKNVLSSFKYYERVINVLGMVEVKRRDEITNETRGADSEPPRVGLADPDSRLSRFC